MYSKTLYIFPVMNNSPHQEMFLFIGYSYALSLDTQGKESPDNAKIYSVFRDFYIQLKNTVSSRNHVKFIMRKKASNKEYEQADENILPDCSRRLILHHYVMQWLDLTMIV